jgi:DNA-directed RNA polymerase subunit beta'
MLLGELLPKQPVRFFRMLVNQSSDEKGDLRADRCRVPQHAVRRNRLSSAIASWRSGSSVACKAGISFGKDDMVDPRYQEGSLVGADPQDLVREFQQQYDDGLITQLEKYNKVD